MAEEAKIVLRGRKRETRNNLRKHWIQSAEIDHVPHTELDQLFVYEVQATIIHNIPGFKQQNPSAT